MVPSHQRTLNGRPEKGWEGNHLMKIQSDQSHTQGYPICCLGSQGRRTEESKEHQVPQGKGQEDQLINVRQQITSQRQVEVFPFKNNVFICHFYASRK